MGSNDPARHALYSRLEEVLGTSEADTLMRHLPRDQHDEVATKSDIALLDGRFDRLEERMDRFEERMDRYEGRMDRFGETLVSQQQFYSRSMVGAMVALTAIFSLVVAFFG
ncbi:MAG: hypothetical protein PVJ28_04280 [Acidimicrobiia bacterium]|jgi:hypothetical protein